MPVNVISANFPGDVFGFFSLITKELLDQNSLNTFLEAISAFINVTLNADTAMSLYQCTLTAIDRTLYSFDFFITLTFSKRLAIKVISYQCEFATAVWAGSALYDVKMGWGFEDIDRHRQVIL